MNLKRYLQLRALNRTHRVVNKRQVILFKPCLVKIIVHAQRQRFIRQINRLYDRDPTGIYVGMQDLLQVLAGFLPELAGSGIGHGQIPDKKRVSEHYSDTTEASLVQTRK